MCRPLRILLVLAILLALVPYLTAFVVVVHSPCIHRRHQTPRDHRLPFEDVTFPSSNGVRLSGWFIPTAHARGTIILCHGAFADRTDGMDLAPVLHEAGFNVFAFDFRHRGHSEKARNTLGKDEVKDLLGAVAYLKTRPPQPPRLALRLPHLIGVLGLSMGGAVAIMAAAECTDIKAVVADSPYGCLDRAIHDHLWVFFGPLKPILAHPTLWHGKRMLGFDPKTVSPESVVARISPRPVLLIHSRRDLVVWPSESRRLYQAARDPKDLWITPRGRHTMSRRACPKEYRRKVVGFFNYMISQPQGSTGR